MLSMFGYAIFLINGKCVAVKADKYEYDDGTYSFFYDDECVAEFQKNNIAGISVAEVEIDEEAD